MAEEKPTSGTIRDLNAEELALIERIGPVEKMPPVPDVLPESQPYKASNFGVQEFEFEGTPAEPTIAAPESMSVHERLREDAVELLVGIYRLKARREPDLKYVDQMRGAYDALSDGLLEKKVAALLKELEAAQAAAPKK